MNERIVWMGTPSISARVLEALLEEGFPIVAVVAQKDKPVGRKGNIVPVPVKEVALKYGLPVYQPEKIKEDYEWLQEINPTLLLTLAYGQIVPQEVLDIPSKGALNLHGSLLPKYRGAAPMQYAIKNGEKETGMCLMRMVKAMDAGEVYDKEVVAIDEKETTATLEKKMIEAAIILAKRAIPLYLEGKLVGVPQDESKVTFAPSIRREEEHLPLHLSAIDAVHYIRSLNDHPGAYVMVDGQKLKIWDAEVSSHEVTAPVGGFVEISKKGVILQLSDGQISCLQLQKEGKGKVSWKDFANAHQMWVGKIVS